MRGRLLGRRTVESLGGAADHGEHAQEQDTSLELGGGRTAVAMSNTV